jgi:RNA polymerase sigma-70 factor (ECF subfamily)
MAGKSSEAVLTREVRALFASGVVGDLTDGQLLERFVSGEGEAAEAAFTGLVERHGPLVLSVCRGVFDDPHDAQDAFQATFLVLLRRAGSIQKRDSIASWLFGVALRLALRARQAAAVRRFHERQGGHLAAARSSAARGHSECEALLHEEISRLPERFREPVVLCYLEGLSTAAAARRIGCAPGTILSRLARGRERLRVRLVRRGLAAPAGLLMAWLTPQEGAAALPAGLVHSTVRAAVPAVALARSAPRNQLIIRLTIAATALAAAAAVTSLAMPLAPPTQQEPESKNDRNVRLRLRHDLALFQGTWRRVSSEVDGRKVYPDPNQPAPDKSQVPTVVFKGDGWYEFEKDGKTLRKNHVIKLDPTSRPKTIDLYLLDDNGKPDARTPIPGIYKIEGDVLTLCLMIGWGPEDRPKEFATRRDPKKGSPWLDVYRRDRTADLSKPAGASPPK